MKNEKTIRITENGPYIVSGRTEVKDDRGRILAAHEKTWLCRCGKSANKPECDGSHRHSGFEDSDSGPVEKTPVRIYTGKEITIYFSPSVCAHRGYCTDELPEVWNSDGNYRVDPDGAPVERVIEICRKCPSGALSFSLPGGERDQSGLSDAEEIRLSPVRYGMSGPYDVTGAIALESGRSAALETEDHYCLCRCGQSKNKPCCDGSHWHDSFRDIKNQKEELE